METIETIRLTELASCAGCAAKLAPGSLAQVLEPLGRMQDPNILVGLQTSDDAAVYKISDDLAIVQTVDFFPPVVDDPFTYGAIAAANAMSDVYAMGGEVSFALNITAFPDDVSLDVLSRIFAGGASKAQEAGIVIAGGHTIADSEPKYGLVVTGTIHPDRVLTKAGAKPGDVLYLTKPLGAGIITTAMKQQGALLEHAEVAVESMLRLNRTASRIAASVPVNACTDVTGFSLLGHSTEICLKSGVAIQIDSRSLPWFPGVREYTQAGHVPGGSGRNQEHYQTAPGCGVTFSDATDETTITLMFSPETSGGLLLSVDPGRTTEIEAGFAAEDHALWRIGEVRAGSGITVA